MNKKVDILILDDSNHVIKFLLNRKIEIYNINVTDAGKVYTIKASDIDRIPFDTKVVGYRGIKEVLCMINKNKFFLIGVILSIVEMYIFSHIIIEVNVLHNDREIRELLYEELEDSGIHQFIFKKSFNNLQKIKAKIKENNKDQIEWLEIIDRGMKYEVRVERRKETRTDSEKKYCDIVSLKDAVITNSLVYKGQAVADVNDFVKKGSLLVSGEIKFNEETKTYTCADAEIYGNTWYNINVKMPYKHSIKVYTGNKMTNFSIKYKDNDKTLFKTHYEMFDTIKKKLFGIGNLAFYKNTQKEYKILSKEYSLEELIKASLKEARKKLKEKVGEKASIIDEKVLQTDEYDSIIVMDIFYSIKEPISKSVDREIPLERMQSDGTS